MPSLHFATSLMAAHVLSEAGPVAGAARLDLRRHARLRARLPRGALRRRPARRARRWPRASGPPARARRPRSPRSRGRSRSWSGGPRGEGVPAQRARRDAAQRQPRTEPPTPPRTAAATTTSRSTEEVESRMLFDRRRLIDLRRRRGRDPGRAVLRCCRSSPASRTRCARSRTPTRSGSRSRSGFNLLSFAAYIALFRGILGGRRVLAAVAASASTGAPRTRSRSRGWPPRGCSRPAARAASRSPTGRCAARGWRRARPRAGWSRSSCCSTRSTCWRS